MRQSCGCFEETQPLTPVAIANPPGLDRLAYRVGDHGRFLATMLARLSSHALPGDGRPLAALTARGGDDPAVALLDAWAIVADVLTFYQERIVNEGYLATATERRSVAELARLTGYRLRPGVSASVLLAYTIDKDPAGKDPSVTIPTGSRAQSVPGPGEQPQTFETAEELQARASWNLLRPQQSQPTRIDSTTATTLGTIWLTGITTGLRPNDRLLAVFATGPAGQVEEPAVLRVVRVTPEPLQDRTRVKLLAPVTEQFAALIERLAARLAEHRDLDRAGLAGGRLATRIDSEALVPLQGVVDRRFPPERLLEVLERTLSRLRFELETVRSRGFRKLTAWLEGLVQDLEPGPGRRSPPPTAALCSGSARC
jgi:hypothetical protein